MLTFLHVIADVFLLVNFQFTSRSDWLMQHLRECWRRGGGAVNIFLERCLCKKVYHDGHSALKLVIISY